MLFITLGGVLADLSWRAPFLIYLFAFVLLPLILLFLYEPEREPRQNEADAGLTLGDLPWRLLSIVYGAGVVLMIVFYTLPVQLPFYLEAVFGASGTLTGVAMASASLFGALSSTFYGRVSARLSYAVILSLSFTLMSVGFLLIGSEPSLALVMVGLAVSGLGLGLALPNLNRWAADSVAARARGRALSGITFAIFLGQFLSPLATQPVVDLTSLATMYIILAGALLTLAVFFGLLRTPLRHLAEQA